MKLWQVTHWLEEVARKHGPELEVDLLIETEGVQYQFPCNDIACSVRSKKVIFMHEEIGPESEEAK